MQGLGLGFRGFRFRISHVGEREFSIDNLLVRIHFIILMMRWTSIASWEFEFPFPGSLTSTFLFRTSEIIRSAVWRCALIRGNQFFSRFLVFKKSKMYFTSDINVFVRSFFPSSENEKNMRFTGSVGSEGLCEFRFSFFGFRVSGFGVDQYNASSRSQPLW